MPLATATDVETSMRRELTEAEAPYVPALLARAETLLLTRIPRLEALAAASPTYSALAIAVEAEAVARVLRAENSGTYLTETEDGYSYRLNLKVASGLLDILPEEWARLLGTGGFRSVAPRMGGYAIARRAGQSARARFERGQ